MKAFLLVPAAIALLAASAEATLVREASLDSACQGEIPVVVYSGMGSAIDFTQTGSVVQRAWLGDPSKVTLDFDRPIEQGSSVLFLRRISQVNFDGLPSTETTVLTAVVASGSGSQVCQFPVSYSSATPDFTSLRLTDEYSLQPEASAAAPRSGTAQLVNIDDVEAGIDSNALALGQDHPVVVQIKDFIARVRSGEPQAATAEEMAISWDLIVELERQGADDIVFSEAFY
jgi:hypothetical protein